MSCECEEFSWKGGDKAGRDFLQVMPLRCKRLLFLCVVRHASVVVLTDMAIMDCNEASVESSWEKEMPSPALLKLRGSAGEGAEPYHLICCFLNGGVPFWPVFSSSWFLGCVSKKRFEDGLDLVTVSG